jgi:hypothetical protein
VRVIPPGNAGTHADNSSADFRARHRQAFFEILGQVLKLCKGEGGMIPHSAEIGRGVIRNARLPRASVTVGACEGSRETLGARRRAGWRRP